MHKHKIILSEGSTDGQSSPVSLARKKTIKFLQFAVFIFILGFVFTRVTYLFRTVDYNRRQPAGLACENVDVVYIGGSSTFTYWQPLKAWCDHGITSYVFAHDHMEVEEIIPFIEEAKRTQDPKLFVIDIKPFQIWDRGGQQLDSFGPECTWSFQFKSPKDDKKLF